MGADWKSPLMSGQRSNSSHPEALCVVVGAGEIQDYAAVAKWLEPDSFVICADGGMKHMEPLGLAPHLWMGDEDSLAQALPEAVPRLPLSPDKNYTDSYHSVEEAISRGYRRFLLTGMLGGRLDHTIANLQLLAHAVSLGGDALLTDGLVEARALIGEGELMMLPRENCYFSLLSLDFCRKVTIFGGRYPLDDYDLASDDPRAVSNEFCGKTVRIVQQSGRLIVLSLPKDDNGRTKPEAPSLILL